MARGTGKIIGATNMGKGVDMSPSNHVAFLPEHPWQRGGQSSSPRISRVGSTAKPSGSGSAGGTL